MEEGCAVPRTTDAWHPVIQIWPPELTNLKTRACSAAALKSYRERLAGVRNGEVWGVDDPGPYTDDEKAREIARLEGAIASIGSLGEELEVAIASTRCRSPRPQQFTMGQQHPQFLSAVAIKSRPHNPRDTACKP